MVLLPAGTDEQERLVVESQRKGTHRARNRRRATMPSGRLARRELLIGEAEER
jgi:hypothetical protein